MKVKELIALLQVQDQEAEVEVPIHQFNKRYPVHYASTGKPTYLNAVTGPVRIDVHLPDNMYTVTKK